MKKIIVIGGGAAGMMAAIAAAQAGAQVILLEKNEKLGKKIFITGKGRCNVTNAADMDTLFANVCTNEKFLYSAFYQYNNQAVMTFLEESGCPLKVERGDRVFPVSDHSSDVIATLQKEMNRLGIEVLLHTEAKRLVVEESEEKNTKMPVDNKAVAGVRLADGKMLSADAVIVCTGGVSYATTGSTGDGHRFAEETGHRIVECKPALVPLETAESWCRDLMGLSLKNVSVRMVSGKKELYSGFGEMLFTHFGVSGPLILSASSFYYHGPDKNAKAKKKSEDAEAVKLYIDLKPALDEEQLDKRILRDFEENKNKQFKNVLGGLFPTKLIPVMIDLSEIHPDKKVNEITREERRAFVSLIKNLPLTIIGTRPFAEAIITQGGVCVRDVNPSTMESKKVKNLYFAGEVLDLDAMTGGFNLQIAWSTGHLAGMSSAAATLPE